MAINILTEPTDPPIAGDFTLDQAIQHAAETPQLSILTTWESTGAAPAAKQGVFIRHAANTFQVQGSDEAISGSVTAGLNYIIATETAGVITLAWATTLTGYSYNPAYGGIYDSSGNQALRDLCYLDGTDYNRGMSYGQDFNSYRLANGNVKLIEILGGVSIGGATDLKGALLLSESTSEGSEVVAGGGEWIIPRGLYSITTNFANIARSQIYVNGFWRLTETIDSGTYGRPGVQIYSDGSNSKIRIDGGSGVTIYWRKH